ncbi:hypothetical protein [Mucilaginibacter glaciei]|uniref:Uncharacterized protein n=1 Tax=Mucilaginibacter glaciei TaxID=2772109 RepID=A0A926NU77_9SPHI|nr:hypothetical protein [Mucilaginibacter glaciei]MBD1391858.1 hypothetical protein [Mucilaginibacter glaciei]
MRIEPNKQKEDIYEDLTPFEKKTRIVAVIFAFCGVFVWALKILLV